MIIITSYDKQACGGYPLGGTSEQGKKEIKGTERGRKKIL